MKNKHTKKIKLEQPDFLPMTRQEMQQLGWKELDILLVSGDAYVDHPSFGISLLGRWLIAHGYKVGLVAQPNWEQHNKNGAQPNWEQHNKNGALSDMGRPRLFAGVSAGAIDSMLAHYTAFRKKRHDDAYTPGGKAGARPNRATIIYSNLLRQTFQDIPIVLGGIEASLRRCTHYDFWTDALRRPILCDSKADMLIYGMGENAILDLANKANNACLAKGLEHLKRADFVEACKFSLGTAFIASDDDILNLQQLAENALGENSAESSPKSSQEPSPESNPEPKYETFELPSLEELKAQPSLLIKSALDLEDQVHRRSSYMIEKVGLKRNLVLSPPAKSLSTQELDYLYDLPFSRLPHPCYTASIPAWEMIRTSITTHRGCGGGCSFCSLALHQGRGIASRSAQSILDEACQIAAGPKAYNQQTKKLSVAKTPKWAGSISDAGGPSANMWQAFCSAEPKQCKRRSCMFPKICAHFKVDQLKGVKLLRDITKQEGVRNLRVASGLRLDLALTEPEALAAYTTEFTGGQLKIAPEHSSDNVLRLMRKPKLATFEQFLQSFDKYSKQAGKEQYIVPYLMSAFPGCNEQDMHELKRWLKQKGWQPQQVQCFIPTPGTVATAMFFAGQDAEGNAIVVAKTDAERMRQHYILFDDPNHKPNNRSNNSPNNKNAPNNNYEVEDWK